MRTNYVLIDYENVQPETLSQLAKDHVKVMVFVGANQSKVNFEVAAALQTMGDRAQYIKISSSGPNALDFHIAFYIGMIANQDPGAYFHIISKDTGFDPLIQHLKTRKVLACRSKTISDMPMVKAVNSKTPDERIEVVIADLKRRGASRPRAVKTLTSTIASIFQKKLSDLEVSELIAGLQNLGFITVTENKVAYSLPT